MSPEMQKEKRVRELKQITVLMFIFLISSALAVVVGSDLASAADDDNESISVGFSASPLSGEAPLTVQFTDESTGSPTTWKWNFGDGNTSTAENPSHKYYRAGSYTVSLTVNDGATSDSDVKENFITVREPEKPEVPVVTASFETDVTSGKVPLTVRFTDTSTGGPTSWKWNFGDGATSTAQNPSHTYSTAGTYSVTLVATNGTVSDDFEKSITAGNGPTASFTASPTEGVAPLTVKFTDTSTGSPTRWEWDFGDGSTLSTAQNPSHTYSGPGTYTVKLTVTNAYGPNTASSTVHSYLITAPVADFISSVTSGSEPLSVQFTDLSTNGATGWEWDFNGDGRIDSTVQNPLYVYTAPGTYSVTLSALNGTARGSVTKPNYITVGGSLLASFTMSPQQGNAPLAVEFNDTSSGNATGWIWDFGDGNTSASQNPSHIYFSAGNYAVKLTVTNAYGSNTSAPSFVNVSFATAPVPDFTSNITSGKAPLTIQFQDLSTGGPTAWEWDFNGDGIMDSTEQNPVYEFTTDGFYNVTLKAGNSTAWANITKPGYILVGEGLHASFIASVYSGDAPLTVQFTDTSTGNATSWLWDFGDSNTSTVQNPVHEYSVPGSYSVTLNVSNAYGYSTVTWAEYIKVGEEKESSGSGGSGGGSSGGGGGSPEPASNIEAKELAQKFVTTGDRVKFEFTRNATAIMYVKFDSKRNFGKVTTSIEQLKNRSVLTPKEPSGKVYKYLNIWVGNEGFATPENIANAIIGFRVKSSEISENETEGPSVFMYRYSDGKWNALPTREMGKDDQYTYFESRTPGFSPFAIITGKKAIELIENETIDEDQIPELPGIPRQEMPNSLEETEHKDWSKVSRAVKVIVGFMVVLLIWIAVNEKNKR